MSNFEIAAFCDLSEYDQYENSRLGEAELQQDELYMMMVALAAQIEGKQALRYPVRVGGKEHSEGSLWVVRLSFLDHDLSPVHTTDAQFGDGYWQDAASTHFKGVVAQAGYLKGYADGMDDELLRISEEAGLHTPA